MQGKLIILFSVGLLFCASCKKEVEKEAELVPVEEITSTNQENNEAVQGAPVVNNADDPSSNPSPEGQGPTTHLLLDRVNAVRATGCQCGGVAYPPVPALVWVEALENAAIRHSTDMAQTAVLSHTGSDGSKARDRVSAEGYVFSWLGENIARGQQTESHVMSSWLASEGHCKNIMSANFSEFAASKVGVYWTQVFGASSIASMFSIFPLFMLKRNKVCIL